MKLQNFSYKILFAIFFFAVAGIIFFLKIGGKTQKVSAAWWNSNWHYRRSITLTNSSGAGRTNVLVKVLENYDLSGFVSAGKLQSDLDDLRFTDSSDTAINYWIEDATNTSVDIWAIVPSLPTSGTSIWMYYGNSAATGSSISSPFSYTGSSQIISDGNSKFRVKFFTSGTFNPTSNMMIDVFLVGGGGGGHSYGGGGGGYTNTHSAVSITAGTGYGVTIGAGGYSSDGGGTTGFGYTANGGVRAGYYAGGNGGSGGGGGPLVTTSGWAGDGGSNGGNGAEGCHGGSINCAAGGSGQGTTTREFGEAGGTLYAGGGGGHIYYSTYNYHAFANGGAGGGGTQSNGATNTGGGGAGDGYSGGSGIAVIRYTSPGSYSLNSAEEGHPNVPSLDSPTNGASSQPLSLSLKTTTTDGDNNYIRYKIEICKNAAMTTSCQTFDQTSSQTGWSGQNTQSGTAYTSGTQATYTTQTNLDSNTTYYWRSYAIDPGGSNIWSPSQNQPYIFTTETNWWNGSWRYRRSIAISNTSGTDQTYALVRIFENYNLSGLVSSGKLQSSLNDIRFIDNSGNQITYWIYDATNTSVDIWAVIPTLPSAGTSIWMYYGNSSATSVSTRFYSYAGSSHQFIDDGGNKFRIKFLSTGGYNFSSLANIKIDAFLVGGGSSLGGSGYTTTVNNINITRNSSYTVTVGVGGAVGSNGAASTAFGSTANPGSGSNGGSGSGASGYTWSGGTGGSDGTDGYGSGSGWNAGTGQGTTTREFGQSTGTLYSGGGGGGGGYLSGYSFTGGAGGAGGGGNGAGTSTAATNGVANTGGGAGLGIRGVAAATGGSGIVVIRHTFLGSITISPTEEDFGNLPAPTQCLIEESPNDTNLKVNWVDNAIYEDSYYVEKSTDGGSWSNIYTSGPNVTSYTDTNISSNHTYQYRIAPHNSVVTIDNWCYTSVLNLGRGNFNFEGLNLEGINLD